MQLKNEGKYLLNSPRTTICAGDITAFAGRLLLGVGSIWFWITGAG